MPRKRNPDRDRAREIWEASNRKKKLKDIAEMLQIPEVRVRKWRSEDKWESERSDSEIKVEKERKGTERERRQRERRIEKKMVETVQQNEALSEQERLFCLYYIKSFNGTRSYQKAFGCSYDSARANGHRLLTYARVRDEIMHLKQMRQLDLMADQDDLVMMHMRIAFANITDFVEFGERQEPILNDGTPAYTLDQDTLEMVAVTKTVHDTRIRGSDEIDGQLVREIKPGKYGLSLKLEDRQKSLAFLERFFLANPLDMHRIEYDQARLELDRGGDNETLEEAWTILGGVQHGFDEQTTGVPESGESSMEL